ncbi:hypothetical protein LEN26_020835 [Aphanomyces euteiches]|nr:hypothetical protein LEN26_020835 [Aphanomyces euteiches]KAH9112922.1 hypothetical protein AeMF1_012807 [Aphanomyces euteiches]KAH9192709.1 hypothetical protein AeNC1_005321 [Aphanomyces euteiches]
MLAVQLKQTAAIDVTKPMRAYISKEYSEDEAKKFDPALASFAQMRKDVELVRTPSPISRQVLLRYVAQLDLIESRFPVGDTKVKIPFTWFDSFSPRQKLTQHSIKFEQAAVLFLVGALDSQSAVACDRSSPEGIKAACHYFSQSAGAFAAIQEMGLSGTTTVDMCPEGLGMLVNLMLAQAQACFYEKAIKDKMKDGIKSKLATQAVAFYSSALEFCNSSTMKSSIDRLWSVHIQFQVLCMKAAAQFWQGKASKEVALTKGIGYGEEICRLSAADALCTQAITLATQSKLPPSLPASVRALQAIVVETLNKARKDNDTIYMETIPQLASLPTLTAASMVKPILPEKEKSIDLFEGLVPTWLRQKSADCEAICQSFVSASAAQVSAQNEAARVHLASLGLPASVEAFEKGTGVPPALWKRIESCQVQGLTAPISRILEENKRSKARVEEQLRTIENLLRDEAADDQQARGAYGPAWTRPTSIALNEGFMADVDRYHKLLRDATQSDLAIQSSLNAPALALLGQNQSELEHRIPERDPSAAAVDTSLLNNLMVALGLLIQKRDELQKEMAAKATLPPSLAVLAASDELVFANKQAEVEQLKLQIEGTFAEQGDLLTDITERNEIFKHARQADPITRQREEAILELQKAVDLYEQLFSNATEGGTFYSELTQKLAQLEQTVVDHCAARELEKRELELNLQSAQDSALAQRLHETNLHDHQTQVQDQVASDAAFAAALASQDSKHPSAPPSQPQQQQQYGGYPAAAPAYAPLNQHPANPYAPNYGQSPQQPPPPPQYNHPQYNMYNAPPQYPPQYAQYPPQYPPPYGAPQQPQGYPQQPPPGYGQAPPGYGQPPPPAYTQPPPYNNSPYGYQPPPRV